MLVVILPTSEILRRLRPISELFSFYQEGLRDVVRDFILRSEPMHISETRQLIPKLARDFQERLLFEYINSWRALSLYHSERTSEELYIELGIETINEIVYEVLQQHFRNKTVRFVEKEWYWLGDDLVIKAIVEER